MKPYIKLNVLICLAVIWISFSCADPIVSKQLGQDKEILPRFENGKYYTEMEKMTMSAKDLFSSTWQFIFEKNDRTPVRPLPVQPVDLSYFNNRENRGVNSTWLGHSTLMINIGGYKILTDPVFEKKVSVVGPTRFNGDLPLHTDLLSDIDLVIISHNHYDHLNKYSIGILKNRTKKFITPPGVGKKLSSWGIPEERIVELNWWETFDFNEDLSVIATPAQHFSGRGLGDRNKTLWASWVITTPDNRIFFSGDSGYFDGFKAIGNAYGPFDMTFMECGSYNKSWHPVHMFPEETVQAHLDLKGDILHPIHWGTFNLALHPWYEPMQRLKKSAESENICIATPKPGETISRDILMRGSSWWEKSMGNAL